MRLREDSDQYCLIWLGLMLLGAFYFHFGFIMITQPAYIPLIAGNFVFLLLILALPPAMVFFFTGYLRPARGKAKRAALGPAMVSAMFFVILTYLMSIGTDMLGNVLYFSAWGIGSSLLTAGGLSILQSEEMGTTSGMLDVSSLHYGPPKEEPANPEEEALSVTEESAATEE